jgi:hypothetical protein
LSTCLLYTHVVKFEVRHQRRTSEAMPSALPSAPIHLASSASGRRSSDTMPGGTCVISRLCASHLIDRREGASFGLTLWCTSRSGFTRYDSARYTFALSAVARARKRCWTSECKRLRRHSAVAGIAFSTRWSREGMIATRPTPSPAQHSLVEVLADNFRRRCRWRGAVIISAAELAGVKRTDGGMPWKPYYVLSRKSNPTGG